MVDVELQELLEDFLSECDERLATVESALLEIDDGAAQAQPELLESVRRDLHTLKGNSGMMGLADLQGLAHRLEDTVAELDPVSPDVSHLLKGVDEFKELLGALRTPTDAGASEVAAAPEPTADSRQRVSVRVATDELDRLLDLATETLVLRTQLAELTARALALDPDGPDYAQSVTDSLRGLEETRLDLEKALTPLDDGLRRLRMVPLKNLFGRLQRIVHDEAERGGKLVQLITRGEETPLDAALVEVAADALGHLVRNAVVHGIEPPAERSSKGKPAEGTVLLEALVRGRWVEIEVFDNGAGIDSSRLRQAAADKGFDIGPDTTLQDLVFRPGLTTRAEADQSSGRGIGASAVLEAVHRYGGTIDIDTAPDVGSRFLLRLPLTVALTEALILTVDDQRFALPIGSILETTGGKENELRAPDGQRFLEREGINIPATDLADFLGAGQQHASREHAVVLTSEGKLRALLVDDLGDVVTIVVNPLDPAFGQPMGIGGTTVLGSGDVVMILDPQAFVGSTSEVAS